MTTTETPEPARRVAEHLAAVVIAAVRPDTPDGDLRSAAITAAAERLGGELLGLLRELEPDGTVRPQDSAIARAAHLAAHITLAEQPDVTSREE